MLRDFIADAKADDTPIMQLRFENETLSETDLAKIDFESVHFIKCRFTACDFIKANFYRVIFEDCDISNCEFSGSYWKGSKIINCKAIGSCFTQASFNDTRIEGSAFHYANCVKTAWTGSAVSDCDFKEAFMSEAKLKSLVLNQVNLTRVDFFKTPLKGVDLSACVIDGILLSETYAELRGVKVSMEQAAGLAQLLGVQIV